MSMPDGITSHTFDEHAPVPTVAKLIAVLSTLDPDAVPCLDDGRCGYVAIGGVSVEVSDAMPGTVWLTAGAA